MNYYLQLIFFILCPSLGFCSDNPIIERVEPPFWWAGMEHSELQLMVHGDNISTLTVHVNYDGLKMDEVIRVENPNYLFLNFELGSELAPGKFPITFKKGKKEVFSYNYEIKQRRASSAERVGFDNSDIIYLITPDRFVNGDPSNDNIENLKERSNISDKNGRHGGDIKGMISSLDYLNELGFTAIWSNPLLENDMEKFSYHGYSTTDFYKIDERFGSMQDYLDLSEEAEKRGLKIIMDMIANHCGKNHYWTADPPTDDWYHYQNAEIKAFTTHKRETLKDPHAAASDRKKHSDGWFVNSMPDLNQKNPLLAEYLIQNSIWWVEHANLGGIRQDTYSYPDPDFMTEWSCRIMTEYPNFNIVGEEWSLDPAIVSSWQRSNEYSLDGESCLPSLFDFPLQQAIRNSLNEPVLENSNSMTELYSTLGKDFLYNNPNNLVTFLDNHDMARFYNQVNEDLELFKMGLIYLYSTRGIPQIFYGTELLLNTSEDENDHALIRADMLGGWQNDSVNVFTGDNLNSEQIEILDLIKSLNFLRREYTALQRGTLTHYSPEEEVYVLFRTDEQAKFMCVFNKNAHEVNLDVDRFSQFVNKGNTFVNAVTNKLYPASEFTLKGKSASIFKVN